ncbi:hypothetical protein AB0M80_43335 [Amycolatopsis sp. NPDC051045]|uniref:hypothetical protein n=1 Tax=Amycolatopsis sp. NPDC051045 TaxID=3156922 RepID=UPI00343664B4
MDFSQSVIVYALVAVLLTAAVIALVRKYNPFWIFLAAGALLLAAITIAQKDPVMLQALGQFFASLRAFG